MAGAADQRPRPDAVVHLEGVPVRAFLESQDHQHDLMREFQLVRLGQQHDLVDTQVPAELARLVGDILNRYSGVRSATRAQVAAALARGEQVTSVDVPVWPGMAEALREWLQLLETADGICDTGRLLVLPSSPEVRAVRRWYVEQITSRLDDPSG